MLNIYALLMNIFIFYAFLVFLIYYRKKTKGGIKIDIGAILMYNNEVKTVAERPDNIRPRSSSSRCRRDKAERSCNMLSPVFKNRMSAILGDDYAAFIRALEEDKSVRGMRVNTLMASAERVEELFDHKLEPIPYCEEGFIPENAEGIGNTPEHHAGMIYMQDPGAMAALCALDAIPADAWVLDMCSAPGGKSSQIAARIPDGFLLANEFVPKRAKTVVSNLERMGVKNAAVISLDTKELPRMFSCTFDFVICDAPCSGEGMFRKSDEALTDWSEENVKMCAERQLKILKNAPSLIKGGGYLLYSTCTYSLEENEMTVDSFLAENPEFSLVDVPKKLHEATADGIVFDGAKCTELSKCRRFYPHISKGEGQFVALMKKSENAGGLPTILYKTAEKPLKKDELSVVQKFFFDNFTAVPKGRISKVGENILIIPHSCPIPERSVFMGGVLIGEIVKGVLHPSHQLFSAYGALMKRREELSKGDRRVAAYLRGEEIDAVGMQDSGWCAVMYYGATLGGGKASGGRIKNHYPKGLRLK